MKAADFLRQAAEVIEQRGTLRDKPDGERSMERAVDAFITLNGPNLQGELDGWLFLCVLKLARATAGGAPHLDDYTDLAGYAALAAECVQREADAEQVYEDKLDRYVGTGVKYWGLDEEPAAPQPDALGRTGNEPLDMSAFTKETPLTDRLYGREEEEAEATRACYESMLPEKKPNESSPAAPAAEERSDGWIEHNGGPAPAFKGHVEVYIRTNHGTEYPTANAPRMWHGWEYDPEYCITHYKIKEEN